MPRASDLYAVARALDLTIAELTWSSGDRLDWPPVSAVVVRECR
ncbi:hypothetical protein A7982_12820 [Minicystis rosea]|nr:hypothetical protein A7982_12820 [Minicystis rosea]